MFELNACARESAGMCVRESACVRERTGGREGEATRLCCKGRGNFFINDNRQKNSRVRVCVCVCVSI